MTRRALGLALSAAIAVTVGSVAATAQRGRAPSPEGTAATEVRGRYVGNGDGTVYQGGKGIEVTYSRPIKRGRDLWGTGADCGRLLNDTAAVWGAGANVSTRLRTELPLVMNNKRVAAGE